MKDNRETLKIIFIYLSAFVFGLVLVSYPSSSDLFIKDFGVTKEVYGSAFIPVVIGGILGSFISGSIKKLKYSLLISLSFALLSQVILFFLNSDYATVMILTGMTFVGIGFGLSGSPLNTFPGIFFPNKTETALVSIHTLLGVGLATGPLIFNSLLAKWQLFPITVFFLVLLCLIALSIVLTGQEEAPSENINQKEQIPFHKPALWFFASIALVYALAEATFANWCVVFLQQDKQLSSTIATSSLSLFWFSVSGGRLVISALLTKFKSEVIWALLPIVFGVALLLLPQVDSGNFALLSYSIAGLGCSAFFPLTVGLATKSFPEAKTAIPALMTAALLCGVGIASYGLGILQSQVPLSKLFVYSVSYSVLLLVLIFAVGLGNKKSTFIEPEPVRVKA